VASSQQKRDDRSTAREEVLAVPSTPEQTDSVPRRASPASPMHLKLPTESLPVVNVQGWDESYVLRDLNGEVSRGAKRDLNSHFHFEGEGYVAKLARRS
jgi:hypothetical protein